MSCVIVAKKLRKWAARVYFVSPVSGIEAGGVSTMTRLSAFRSFRTLSIASFATIVLCIFGAPDPAAAQEGQKGQIHVQKVCPAATFTGAPGSYCTIIVSDLATISANVTRVYYDE